MAQMFNEISSVQPRDPELVRAAKPKRFKFINVPFVAILTLLVAFGLLVQLSATSADADYSFARQLSGVLIGLVLAIGISRLDYHVLSGYTTLFLILIVVLLISPHLPFIGVTNKGATSWIKIGPLPQLQPGEFAKVLVVLLCASVMARYGGRLDDLREYVKVVAILAVPFVCILTQPDFGTGLVYVVIAAFTLIMGGANWRFMVGTVFALLGLFALLVVTDPILDGIAGHDVGLKDYQMSRLMVWNDSTVDTSGDGYNVQQAMIAIGSGGLTGKGFMQATQSTLGFLPEAPTDFVFCVLAEEFGFVGAVILLVMYAVLIAVSVGIALRSNDLFGTLIVMGAVGIWVFQIFENIGMDIGLMPVTGIPLPFISYGTSFMIMNFCLIGLINSVWVHNGH
ncbi:MAG: rod shape-determining protein RodA [Coriobacteriia bacterium]|nr:rod shape-determining protein RodA [Coriobacteriia bacterium]